MVLDEFSKYVNHSYDMLSSIDTNLEKMMHLNPEKIKDIKLKVRKAKELVEFMQEELPTESVWEDHLRLMREAVADVYEIRRKK